MSKIFFLLSFIILTFSSLFAASTVSANGCAGWTLGIGCAKPGQIEYCKNGSCTLEKGLEATNTAVNKLFEQKTIAEYATDVVRYFLGFVTLVGVIYILYAGLQLMTGGGDEEKVKKARQIIVYVLAGIILMWLSYWIVALVIDAVR